MQTRMALLQTLHRPRQDIGPGPDDIGAPSPLGAQRRHLIQQIHTGNPLFGRQAQKAQAPQNPHAIDDCGIGAKDGQTERRIGP